jgi:hypothetical protein
MECIVNGCEGSPLQPVSILPADITLRHAAKLSLEHGKAIRMDYFIPSLKGEVCIGQYKEEKLLIKTGDRTTILKVYKTGREYIIIGLHDIYIVADTIKKRVVKFETGS